MELNRDFKRLIEELGAAINESLAESERIGEVMTRIKAAGYDMILVLEVTIGVDKRGSTETIQRHKIKRSRLQMTGEDVEFLKALQITLDDDPKE